MEKVTVFLCLCLLGTGCESPPATSGKVSPGDVMFLSAPTPDAHRVGWTSVNDHLIRHYADDAMTQMRQAAAAKGANGVVLLGVDPPDTTGNFGQFEVHGYLATVYVWADLYYCPGLTHSPAREMPDHQSSPVQFTSVSSTSPVVAAPTTIGAR